ncbi:MAG: hypothetical protein EXR64_00805 [Dehalococcoidia bacterium]|nr:hypothetical protein [Dehalococcoidia bacterium]
MFGTQQRALRAGLAAAAMIGLAVTPTAVMAHDGASSHPGTAAAAQIAPRTNHLEALAKALGVTPEALAAAMETANEAGQKQRLATLAATLKLDVAKVQAALDAARPQRGDDGRRGRGPGVPGLHDFGGRHLEAVANVLGVTPEALKAAMQAAREAAGKPDPATMRDPAARAAFELKVLTAVAEKLGVTVAKLQEALKAGQPDRAQMRTEARVHLVERLEAAVESGKITQDEADALLARLDSSERPDRIDPEHAKTEARPPGRAPQGRGRERQAHARRGRRHAGPLRRGGLHEA